MKTKIIVVGFGFMGQTHAGNLLKNDQAELVGIVDPCDPAERLSTIKGNKATVTITIDQARKIPHYLNLDDALAQAHADAVIIALPTKLHYPAVIKCLNAGLHVMVEKPFSISESECEEMVRLADEKKRLLTVGYVVRCMREYEILKEAIATCRFGKLKLLKMSRITGIPAWGNWNDPEFIKASGGSLFDLVSHDIDFARFCLGDPEKIETVPALSGDQFILISTVFRYADCNVDIEGGFVTPSTYPFRRNFTAFFEKATLISDAQGELQIVTSDGITREDYSMIDPYHTEVCRFVQAIQSGDTGKVCLGSDARHSIDCCFRIARQINYPLPDPK